MLQDWFLLRQVVLLYCSSRKRPDVPRALLLSSRRISCEREVTFSWVAMRKVRSAAGILFLCLALAVCVYGRPEPSRNPNSNVANQAADYGGASLAAIAQGVLVGVDVQSSLALATPFAVERRSLKAKIGREGGKSAAALAGGSTSAAVAFVVICLLILFFLWRRGQRKADPKFRVRDMFKSKEKNVDKGAEKGISLPDKPSS